MAMQAKWSRAVKLRIEAQEWQFLSMKLYFMFVASRFEVRGNGPKLENLQISGIFVCRTWVTSRYLIEIIIFSIKDQALLKSEFWT